MLFPTFLSGQTIQIGSGITQSSGYTSSPVNIYYRRTVCQFVLTANELSQANASSVSPMSSFGFYVTQAPIYNIPGYTIKVKHTTNTDVSTALGTTGWTTIRSGFTYAPTAGGYDMIALDGNFTWDGTSNIGVEICWSRVTPTWNLSGKVRTCPMSNGYRYSWTDAGGSSCGSTPGTITSDKPQVQIVFLPGTSTTWDGSVSSDWFDAFNWSSGVPTPIMDAVIPSGASNMPTINGSHAAVKDIDIQSGATLTISGGDTLTVYEDWNLSGDFVANKSTILFEGESATPNVMTGVDNQPFFNLEVNSVAGVTMSTGTYDILGSLRLKGGTLTSNNKATLLSNTNSTGRLSEIRNICGYTLDMDDSFGDGWDGAYIDIHIDGVHYGKFAALGAGTEVTLNVPNTSSLTITYTAGAFENENRYRLIDPLGNTVFSDGTSPTPGLVHTETGTCAFSLPFSGDLSQQRYLNLAQDGWREMTAGVTGQSLANWNDDGLIMTNFTGSNFPSFGWSSVYTYNENSADGVKDDGWLPADNITNALSPNKGHRLYIGTGTYTIEVAGPPFAGDKVFTLDYQNTLPAETAAAEDQKGWNLIGNPYPCSFHWDSIPGGNKVNMDNALWVWSANAGNYGVYQGGTGGSGTNDVNANVASSQAFWLHANTTGASLTLNEAQKTENDPVFVRSFEALEHLKIRLDGAPTNYQDEAILVWKDESTNLLDGFDALKLFSPEEEAPSLSMVVEESTHLSINSISTDGNPITTPLQTDVGIPGEYTLHFEGVNETNDGTCLLLKDRLLDSIIDLHVHMEYSFYQDTISEEARFDLISGGSFNGDVSSECRFSTPFIATSINEELEGTLGIYPNPTSDYLNIQTPYQADILSLKVYNLQGQLLIQSASSSSNQGVDVSQLSNGPYFLQVAFQSGVINKRFNVSK